MIGVRMIITNDPQTSAARVIIGALGLLRCYQIPSLSRLLAFIYGRVDFGEHIHFTFTCTHKESAALVRVGLLAVFAYLIQMS